MGVNNTDHKNRKAFMTVENYFQCQLENSEDINNQGYIYTNMYIMRRE